MQLKARVDLNSFPSTRIPLDRVRLCHGRHGAQQTWRISRGEVFRLIGMSERSGRDILGSLLQEGLLISDSPRGSVRLGFPTHAAGYWFPELYPPEKTVSDL